MARLDKELGFALLNRDLLQQVALGAIRSAIPLALATRLPLCQIPRPDIVACQLLPPLQNHFCGDISEGN